MWWLHSRRFKGLAASTMCCLSVGYSPDFKQALNRFSDPLLQLLTCCRDRLEWGVVGAADPIVYAGAVLARLDAECYLQSNLLSQGAIT